MYLYLYHSSIKCFSFWWIPSGQQLARSYEKHNIFVCICFCICNVLVFVFSPNYQVFFLLMDPLGSAAGWILWKAQHIFVCTHSYISMVICICICILSYICFTQTSSVFPSDGAQRVSSRLHPIKSTTRICVYLILYFYVYMYMYLYLHMFLYFFHSSIKCFSFRWIPFLATLVALHFTPVSE